MIDPLKLNVKNAEGQLLCPVCGFADFSRVPAYSSEGGMIGTTICPCCFWEPGYDDCALASRQAKASILASVKDYRAKWVKTKQWQGKRDAAPSEYDGARQLNALLKIAPKLE